MSLCPVPPGAAQNESAASVLVSATMTRLTTGDLLVLPSFAWRTMFLLLVGVGRFWTTRPFGMDAYSDSAMQLSEWAANVTLPSLTSSCVFTGTTRFSAPMSL